MLRIGIADADSKYDLWHGGTAKGRLLDEHYGRDDIFRDRFPEWRRPFVEKAEPFDSSLLE